MTGTFRVCVPQSAHLVYQLSVVELEARDLILLVLVLPRQLLVLAICLLVQLTVAFVELGGLLQATALAVTRS